jgi:Receptor family ligand binding region
MLETNATEPWQNKTLLLDTLLSCNFSGVSGQVYFDADGDRVA